MAMAEPQIHSRKRPLGDDASQDNGRAKRLRFGTQEDQKNELHELRAYAEDSELLLCRTETTLAMLRRDIEMRHQLFSQEISDLEFSSYKLTHSQPEPAGPPLRQSLHRTQSAPPPTTTPFFQESDDFDQLKARSALTSSSARTNPLLKPSAPVFGQLGKPKSNIPDLDGLPSLAGMMNSLTGLGDSNGKKAGLVPAAPRLGDFGDLAPHARSKNKPQQLMPPKVKKPKRFGLDDEDSDSYEGAPNFNNSQMDNSSRKRSRLPPNSVAIFRHWLFNHLESPYPSEEEKEELAHKAGLRITQVNNWFTNARRRILPREDGDAHGRRSLPNH